MERSVGFISQRGKYPRLTVHRTVNHSVQFVTGRGVATIEATEAAASGKILILVKLFGNSVA